MSEDDVLFGYRLRVLDYAARTSVSEACRVFGIHRSTYYVWKRRVERHGLEILRPRERRRPRLPNQLSPFVEQRIVAFALGHPGYGPRRIASELRRENWGGIVVSHNGVWRCLKRHGLNSARSGCRWSPATPPRTSRRAGPGAGAPRRGRAPRRAGRHRLLLRRPALGHERRGLAADRDRRRLLLRLGRARQLPARQPDRPQTSTLARRVAAELQAAGWRLERLLTDNGGEFRSRDFHDTLSDLAARHTLIRAGRPQTNGAVEALHRLILEECWRPAFARYLHVRFTGLKRDLAQYVDDYNHEPVHNGRLTQGRIPADIVYGADKVRAR